MGSGDLCLESGALQTGVLCVFHHAGGVVVREVLLYRCIQYFPNGHVARAGDQHHEGAGGECAAKGDVAGEFGVAVVLHADEDDQEAEHHDGVADRHGQARADMKPMLERHGCRPQRCENETAQQAVLQNILLHDDSPVCEVLRMSSACTNGRWRRVILSHDFAANRGIHAKGGCVYESRPSSLLRWTASVRRRAPSLSKARLQCVFTVFSLTKRVSPISRLLRPRATSSRISSSRRVMPRRSRTVSSVATMGVGAAWTATSTMRSRGASSLVPSQMPAPAKRMAIRTP